MNKKLSIFLLVIIAIVFILLGLLVKVSIARSNDTIERIDSKIEAVMDR